MLNLRHTLHAEANRPDPTVGTGVAACPVAGVAANRSPHPGRSTGRSSGRSTRRPESAPLRRAFGRACAALLLSLLVPLTAGAATVISNTAVLDYAIGGVPQAPRPSNRVDLVLRTPASVEFLRYDPASATTLPVATTQFDDGAGGLTDIPAPAATAVQPMPLADAPLYPGAEDLYLRLTDHDRNLLPSVAETILVTVSCAATGDSETLQLTETGPDTGIFSGYLPTTTAGAPARDGILAVTGSCQLGSSYTDAADATDRAADLATIASAAGQLWVEKQALKNTAASGDFVPYRLAVSNTDPVATALATRIIDVLPAGFRYQAGSARIDGTPAADPVLSADGRTLTFAVGDLAPGARREVRYVAAVGTAVRPGTAINSATASDGGGRRSNTARASVQIVEELLRSRAYVVGQVLVGPCDADPEQLKGLGGVRIYLEDGTYSVTDAEGRYHFEGLLPGSHVVQLDLDTLPPMYELLPCEENTRFAGRSFSQFVDLQGGTLWRSDFHVGLRPHQAGDATLALRAVLAAKTAHFTIPVSVGGVDLANLRLTALLPAELAYLPGSSTLDGAPLPDPERSGTSLTWRLGARPAGWQGTLTFVTALGAEGSMELPVKALLSFDTPLQKNQRAPLATVQLAAVRTDGSEVVPTLTVRPRFPTFVAELSAADKAMLDAVIARLRPFRARAILAIGHTDNVRIAPRSRHIFADNFALSQARAASVAAYVGAALGIPPEQIRAEGHADTEPVASNATAEGKALNRRVELLLDGEKLVTTIDYSVPRPESGLQRAATSGLRPGEIETAAAARPPQPPASAEPPVLNAAWLAQAGSTTRLVWPVEGFVPQVDSLEVKLQHRRSEQVELRLNDTPVGTLNFDTLIAVPGGDSVVSCWAGLSLAPGRNRLQAVVRDADGNLAAQLEREIWFVPEAERIEVVAEQSRLVADGSRPPFVALRFTDAAGHPVHPGREFEYRVAPPYAVYHDPAQPVATTGTMKVGADGIALALLDPTSRTGEARLAIPLAQERKELRVWLQPQLRDWVLVGLAEGTDGYNAVSGNMESFAASGDDEDLYEDGRLAFFAKGQVKGEWLLTMAYDSDKARQDVLHQTIDPDSYYTLYGDTTEQRYEAASARKLYLKIERRAFYALFGDFDTALSVTELARYSRSLNGLKSEYRGEQLSYNAFASETRQSKVRDLIPGDGTSGLYRLKRRPLIANSEQVVIEVRDRFHSEVIVSTRTLSRHLDYDIDYAAGTLFFKEPVPSRDADFNPLTIVVDYETTGGDSGYTYGGRAALHPFGETAEVGVSHIHDGSAGRDDTLSGVDATVRLDGATTLRLEAATSEASDGAASSDGSAWLAELSRNGERLSGRAYLREQQEGFGLGQQSASEAGTRKFGGEARYRLGDNWRLDGELARLEKLTSGEEQDLARAGVRFTRPRYQLGLGLLEAVDRLTSGTQCSEQLLTEGHWQASDALTLRASHAQSLGGNDASADFPTRTTLGLDYRLGAAGSAFAEQEFTRGAAEDTRMTRLGLKGRPWEGAQAQSSLGQESSEYGPRVFANTGLKQTWRINPTWSVDAGFDRSDTLRHPGNDPVNGDAPPASGNSEDFTAVSAGANRKAEHWTMSNRLEYRHGESEDKYGLYSGAEGELRHGLALSGRLQLFETRREDGSNGSDAALRLGLAYRPLQTRWIVLDRLDYLFDRETGSDRYNNWRLVNNLNANYRSTDRKLQVSLQYGAKYVQENIDGGNYSGYTDLIGIETRYDVTRDWDLSFRCSVLHSWSLQQFDYSAGPAVGYKVLDNAWLSVGYNFSGFSDRDFSAADYTAQGAYLKFRVKFDQESVRAALARF